MIKSYEYNGNVYKSLSSLCKNNNIDIRKLRYYLNINNNDLALSIKKLRENEQRQVTDLATNITYKSVKDCACSLGMCDSSIRKSLDKNRCIDSKLFTNRTFKNLVYQGKEISIEDFSKIINMSVSYCRSFIPKYNFNLDRMATVLNKRICSKGFIDISTNKRYYNVADCSKELNISKSKIYYHLQAFGYIDSSK